jgi:hypothetical protein
MAPRRRNAVSAWTHRDDGVEPSVDEMDHCRHLVPVDGDPIEAGCEPDDDACDPSRREGQLERDRGALGEADDQGLRAAEIILALRRVAHRGRLHRILAGIDPIAP